MPKRRKKTKTGPTPTLAVPAPPEPEEPAPLVPAGAAELLPRSDESVLPALPADPLRRYFAEIRGYPRLTREQEHDLAVRFREKGDPKAAYELVTSNLRLVVRIAMDYRRSYLNLLDLIQEGNIGLLQAVRKYDPYRGVPFSGYAGYWVRAYVLKYLLDHWSLVRVATTNARRKLFYNLKREQQRLRAQGIEAGPKLLARNLGADEEDVVEVGKAIKARDLSIDQPVRGGEDEDRFVWETMASDAAPPDEQVAREEMREILKAKIAAFAATLKEKELYILEKRLVAEEPVTLQEIGDHFGTTREAVRQAEARLVKRLKEYLKAEIRDLKRFEVKID